MIFKSILAELIYWSLGTFIILFGIVEIVQSHNPMQGWALISLGTVVEFALGINRLIEVYHEKRI